MPRNMQIGYCVIIDYWFTFSPVRIWTIWELSSAAGHPWGQILAAEAVHGADGGAGRVRVRAAVEARLQGES